MLSRIVLVEEHHSWPVQGTHQHHSTIVVYVQRECSITRCYGVRCVENVRAIVVVRLLEQIRIPLLLGHSVQHVVAQLGRIGSTKATKVWRVNGFTVSAFGQSAAWHQRSLFSYLDDDARETILFFQQSHLGLGRENAAQRLSYEFGILYFNEYI